MISNESFILAPRGRTTVNGKYRGCSSYCYHALNVHVQCFSNSFQGTCEFDTENEKKSVQFEMHDNEIGKFLRVSPHIQHFHDNVRGDRAFLSRWK